MALDPSSTPGRRTYIERDTSDEELGAGVKRKRRPAPCDGCRYVP